MNPQPIRMAGKFLLLLLAQMLVCSGVVAAENHPRMPSLTAQEKAWLADGHTVRARVRYWPPFMFEEPQISGIAVDLVRHLGDRMGFEVQFVRSAEGLPEAIDDVAGEQARYDLLPVIKRTPERASRLAISDDYLFPPWVIFTRDDAPFISSINDLHSRSVAVERGYAMQNKLMAGYPQILLLEQADSLSALKAVSTGRAFAYLGNLVNAGYLIREHGLQNLQVAAPSPFGEHTLAMAVRKDWPELASIINKGLASMTAEERSAINKQWLEIDYRSGIDPEVFRAWLAGLALASILVIALILIWNRAMKREVDRRRLVEEQLKLVVEDIGQRVKELHCMHKITEAVRTGENTDDILLAAARIMPSGWQYSELAQARISLGKKVFTSEDFNPGEWVLAADLLVDQQRRGRVEVSYSEPVPEFDEGPFLAQERDLINNIAVTLGEVVARKEAEAKLHHLATHDPLTGLYNRSVLERRLCEEMERARRYDSVLSVMFLDLDHFKDINDTYGHHLGDRVLSGFSRLLEKTLRCTDYAARYGGEEFAAILPETSATVAAELAERLRRIIASEDLVTEGSISFRVTCSIGVASFPEHADSWQTLIDRADQAMYQAKSRGRNRVSAAS